MLWAIVAGVIAPSAVDASETRYQITEINYNIRGRTREYALRSALDLESGQVFDTLGDLVAFLDDQRQLLENQRPIAESDITFAVVGSDNDVLSVRVDVFTVDSWNIIALPFLRYTSDDGLLLSIRARDYNFFGTLERVAGDVDWEAAWPEGGLFEADRVDLILRGVLPFEWRGYDWRWDSGLAVAFVEGASNQYSIRNGLSITYPWLFDLDWTTALVQEVEFRGEGSEDAYWFVTGARLSTSVPTPWTIPGIGAMKYEPATVVRQPYTPGGLSEPRRGATAAFDHGLTAGRINWFGNFRDGTRAALINSNSINLYRALSGSDLKAGLSVVEGQITSYGAFLRDARVPVGVSGRMGGFFQLTGFSGTGLDISPRVRGIRSTAGDALQGEYGMFSNVDLYARAFRAPPVVEGHVGLFLDIGAAAAYSTGITPDDMVFGSGVEVILFPLFSRALYLRASLGFDLRAAVEDTAGDDRRRELFIGIDHHY